MTAFLPEIFGLVETRERLRRLLVSGRLPNGILLVGAKGRGKTTLARAFARAILCGASDGSVPEGASGAVKFDAGTHADFELVEPEENQRLLGIDRIRRLREAFSLTAVEGDRRVAIIPNAESMTQEAGNALLKLLEEPPPGALLILTGRSREAVMETLVSRCLVLPVLPPSTAEVKAFLASHGLEEGRAEVLAALADGRPGHALALAEDNLDTEVLLPAARGLLQAGAPLESATAALALLRGQGLHQEGIRQRFRLLMGILGFVLRGALKAGLGASREHPALDQALEPRTLARLGTDVLESRLRSVLLALRDVDRNVSVDLLLQHMALEWSGSAATMGP